MTACAARRQGHWEEAREAFRAMLSPAARCKPSLCTINTILAAQLRQGQYAQAGPQPHSLCCPWQMHSMSVHLLNVKQMHRTLGVCLADD